MYLDNIKIENTTQWTELHRNKRPFPLHILLQSTKALNRYIYIIIEILLLEIYDNEMLNIFPLF